MIDSRAGLFRLCRLLAMGSALLLVATASASGLWTLLIAAPLVLGTAAVESFSLPVFDNWCRRGYLFLADLAIITLAMLGTSGLPPFLFVMFFVVVLTSLLLAERIRVVLATSMLIGVAAALSVGGAVPGFGLDAGSLLYVPMLLFSAIHFAQVAERLPGSLSTAEQARRETGKLRGLLDITDTIGSSLDVGQVMHAIADRVGDLVDTESCSIVLADGEPRNCFVVASKGHPEVDMMVLDLEKYPEIRRALKTRQPVVIDDVTSNPLLETAREVLQAKGYRSLAVLPLLHREEALGCLILRSKRERPFTRDELRFCKVAAGASANGLKNALLYRDIKQEATRNLVIGDKLRQVLDCTPDMIVATDPIGRVFELNRGAEELTGWSAERMQGRALSDVLDSDLELGVSDGPDQEPQDVTFQRPDGDQVSISLVSAPLSGSDGSEAGRVWIGRDVTKLRRVEVSLAQAGRLSSLGEVVAGVAHELNNPLAGVVGYAELLRAGAQHNDQIRDLDRIVESAMRCQKIVLKLLSFARKHKPEKRYQSLNDCITKVLDLKGYHLRSSQIQILLELDPELPATSFDFHQLEQVILNLLNNAEHAIASIRRPGRIVVQTGARDGRVFLKLQDNGPGVPAAVRERVFDPFFTTKEVGMGTGLGLSVSYGIVEEHGGRIDLSDDNGDSGACFTVWLPIVEGEAVSDAASVSEQEAEDNPLDGCRILIAEDEEVVLELFTRVLQDEGAIVTRTRDGQQAWEKIETEDFDLIITDLRMPNVSGQQLYERAAEERPELLRRFVFATGDLARPETVSFLGNLPNRILPKPFEVETVRRVLAQAISR